MSKQSKTPIPSNIAALTLAAALTFIVPGAGLAFAQGDGLPETSFEITKDRTALLVTDPQNDFLSPKGVAWGVVGKSVKANGTVEHID